MNARSFALPSVALALLLALDAGLFVPARAGETGAAPGARGPGAVSTAVERDSLEAIARFLAIDPATGESRTRFVLREEPLRLVADSLSARLARYAGADVERRSFRIDSNSVSINMRVDSVYTAENLIARVEGNGTVAGTFLITAHYDATASREEGWEENWRTWPAPGADDNATGVAALMESARLLAPQDLPFDLMFVLFSGEELGLLGSRAFVDSLSAIDPGRIIGVLNCDMIGYSRLGFQAGTVVSNPSSGWLSAMIAEAALRSDPAFPLAVVNPGPSNSDHAPFWQASIPAVTFIEPLKENLLIDSPHYHSFADTVGNVDFEQVRRVAAIVVDFVERTAEAGPEIALFPSDVALLKGGVVNSSRVFAVDDTMTVRLKVRNRGSGEAPPGSDMRLEISIESGSVFRSLYSEVLPIPDPLDVRTVEARAVLDGSLLGAARLVASVSPRGMIDEPGDNGVELWAAVEGEEEVVLMHAVQPNPVSTGFRSASLCLNLARGIDIGVFLYNLEGESIGTAYAGSRWGEPLGAGMNCLRMDALFPDIDRLASGIYLYRLVRYDGGRAAADYAGRFAVQQ